VEIREEGIGAEELGEVVEDEGEVGGPADWDDYNLVINWS